MTRNWMLVLTMGVILLAGAVYSVVPRLARAAEENLGGNFLVKGLLGRAGSADLEQARRYLELVAVQTPQGALAYRKLGQLDLAMNDYIQAQEHLSTALRLQSNDPIACLQLGFANEALGQRTSAIQQWSQCRAARYFANRGLARLGQGRLAKAHRDFQIALELDPESPEATRGQCQTLTKLKVWEAAVEVCRTSVIFNPESAEVYHDLGITIWRSGGELAAASASLESAVRLRAYPPYLYDLGRLYRLQGRLDDAVRTFRTILEVWPRNVDAHAALGDVYLAQRRGAEAINEFRLALDFAVGQRWDLWRALGEAYLVEGELDSAIRAYSEAVAVAPDNAGLHRRLAELYEQRGWLEKAVEEYVIVLRLLPTDAMARERLRGLQEILR